jgi:hypothetical protein
MEPRDVVSDFRRRYENTYVWLTLEDCKKETLVHVERVEDSSTKHAILHLQSQEYGQLAINFGSEDHTLRFKYPPVGVFQHGGDAMVFTRRPSRQYRRGICADNSTMVRVTRQVCGERNQWTIDEVASAFKHETFSFKAALGLLKHKANRSVALVDDYSICRSMTPDKNYILWHWTSPIARVGIDGTINKLLEPHYAAEVNKILRGA